MSGFLKHPTVLKQMLDNEELTNGTISTEDGGKFKVHLEVLAGMSSYIMRIVKASKHFDSENILIPGTSKEVVSNLINFMYTGQLHLTLDKVDPLIKAAELLGLWDVIKLCRKFLASNLNDENCFMVYRYAKYNHLLDLKEQSRSYILAHFQEIFPVSSDFLDLEVDDLVAILSSDIVNVHGEENIFWALMRWVERDPVPRVAHIPSLLRCVRFGLCNLQFYERNIWPHPYLNNEECQAIMLQASQVFADSEQGDPRIDDLLDMRHPFLRPRTPAEIIFAMGGWSAGSATSIIETYDIISRRWFMSLAADSVPRAYHGMLWHGGYMYVIGGFDGNQCFSTVRRFDPEIQIWEEKACMYTQRCYVSVAAIGDHIYAMGGYDGHRRNRTCERFDTNINQWKMVASMNQVRSDASADSLNGKIYIAGGFNGTQVLSSAEFYDPKEDLWTPITMMNSPRSGVKLVAYNNYLYIIGGFNGTNRLSTVEKYDPRTRVWLPVPSMSGNRSNFAVAVLFDCLYVIGGFNGLSTVALVECYDHRKNVWASVTSLNLNRSALAACTVKGIANGHQYAFLGNVPPSYA